MAKLALNAGFFFLRVMSSFLFAIRNDLVVIHNVLHSRECIGNAELRKTYACCLNKVTYVMISSDIFYWILLCIFVN
jgi:hypothetical protein